QPECAHLPVCSSINPGDDLCTIRGYGDSNGNSGSLGRESTTMEHRLGDFRPLCRARAEADARGILTGRPGSPDLFRAHTPAQSVTPGESPEVVGRPRVAHHLEVGSGGPESSHTPSHWYIRICSRFVHPIHLRLIRIRAIEA